MATKYAITIVFYLTIIVCLTALLSNGEDNAPAGQGLLAAKNFKLIARVATFSSFNGKPPDTKQDIEEFYSNEQERAYIRVHHNTDRANEPKKIFYYESTRPDFFVELDTDTDSGAQVKCQQTSDFNSFLDYLIGMKSSVGSYGSGLQTRGSTWMKELTSPPIPRHIIGLAKLAFWVDNMREHFVLSNKSEAENSLTARNILTRRYILKKEYCKSFPIESHRVDAFYPNTPDQRVWFGLPVSININRKEGGYTNIQFMAIEPMKEDMYHEQELSSLRPPLDMFAYPVGLDCSKGLNPVGWEYSGDADLSFQMELFDYGNTTMMPSVVSKLFLAYDSKTGFMRSDTMTFYSYTIDIMDPLSQQRFSIYTDTLVDRFEDDSRGNIKAGHGQFDRTMGKSQCIRSSFSLPTDNNFKPFIQFQKLIPMGNGRIRGVNCRAFEMVTDKLPFSLFHPLDYLDQNGYAKTAYSVESDYEGDYNIVYYFVANTMSENQTENDPSTGKVIATYRNQVLGPLMRIDVYLRGKLRYHMDISEFSYGQLSDAPNGDRAAELFSLRDRCTTGRYGSIGNYAKLNVELTLNLDKEAKITSQGIASMLSSSSLRDQAVIRLLASQSRARFLMTDLFDIQTQIIPIDHDNELKIGMEARLIYSDVDFTWPHIVGFASPTSTGLAQFDMSSIDCLVYVAAAAQKVRETNITQIYLNCPNRCLLLQPEAIEFSKDKKQKIVNYSKYMFDSIEETKLNDQYCPLLAIQYEPILSAREHELLTLSTFVHRELRDNKLSFELPGLEAKNIKRYGVSRIPATITHIDISDDHWSSSVGRQVGVAALSAVEKDSVDGLGLTTASGRKYQSDNNLLANRSIDLELLPPMDYVQCHSICASKLDCHSFSVCLNSREIECIISEVDFRDAALLEAIEDKRAGLKSRTARKTISLPYHEGSSEQIELKFDLRCKVYKKNALEMFHKEQSTQLELRNATLVGVESLEKCAEYCWQNNLLFFEKLNRVADELIATGKNSQDTALRLEKEYKEHHVDWCSRFFYLNLAYPSDLVWVKNLVEQKELDKAGICVPVRPFTYERKHEYPLAYRPSAEELEATPRPTFEKYELAYLSLYSVQYGKRIVEDANEMSERRQLRYYIHFGGEYCARNCFLQTSNLVSQCKSFDFVQLRHQDVKNNDIITYCIMHTRTFEELEGSELGNTMIEDVSNNDYSVRPVPSGNDKFTRMQVWHYEPKLYAMSSAMIAKRAFSQIDSVEQSTNSLRVHGFGIFLVLLASVICTGIIVKLRGDTIVDMIASKIGSLRRESVAPMVSTMNNLNSDDVFAV